MPDIQKWVKFSDQLPIHGQRIEVEGTGDRGSWDASMGRVGCLILSNSDVAYGSEYVSGGYSWRPETA
jgi:hypothetical protein